MSKRTNLKTWLVISVFLPAIVSTAGAEIIYVDAGASAGGDGTTWGTAYKYLQDAMDDANSGDQVWVAQGTYYPTMEVGGTGDRYKTFQLKNGVEIYGGFPNSGNPGWADRDPNIYETVLSGDIGTPADNSDNCYHVFYHPYGLALESTAILDGFTITDSNADGSGNHSHGGGMFNYTSSPTVTNCTFSGNSVYSYGGGMLNYAGSNSVLTNCKFSGNSSAAYYGGGILNYTSSPNFVNCTFSGNSADYGGGMYNSFSDPTLINCDFVENLTNPPTNSIQKRGAGMFNDNSDPNLFNCSFVRNKSFDPAGVSSLVCDGGGIYNSNSSPYLYECEFIENHANRSGGGIGNDSGSNPTLDRCTFTGNYVYFSIFTGWGGGGISGGSSSVTNCVFNGNSAYQGGAISGAVMILANCTFSVNNANDGGAIYKEGGSLTVSNCTFVANSAIVDGGGICAIDSTISVSNCILWGNTDAGGTDESAQIHIEGGTPVVGYCCVEGLTGGLGGLGNIDADPCFVESGYWADVNDPNTVVEPNDPNAVWVDGDYHLLAGSGCIDAGDNNSVPLDTTDLDGDGNTTELIPWDLDGGPRIVNLRVDMGAYEYSVVFDSNSDVISNLWLGLTDVGDSYSLVGYGTFTGSTRSYSLIGSENVMGVDCLILRVLGHGPDVPDEYYDPRIAQDTSGNIRVLKITGVDGDGNSILWQPDSAGTSPVFIPGNPQPGQVFPFWNEEYHEVVALNVPVPQMSTGVGPYNGCMQYRWGDNESGDTDEHYHCPGVGIVKEVWDDEGMSNGWERLPIYVDDSAPNDPGSGTQTDPYRRIQDGVNVAKDGEFVMVLDGIYAGVGNRDIDFGGKAITVKSENGADNCIIDCQRQGRGFIFHSNEDSNSVVEGLTIANGLAPAGGGILCNGSSPTIYNCVLNNNGAFQFGGGICNMSSSPTISRCTFSNNITAQFGGGMFNLNSSSPTVSNCIFSLNGAMKLGGGMLNANNSDAAVINCTFVRNRAVQIGGGMCNIASSPELTNSIILGNQDSTGMNESAQITQGPGALTINYCCVQGLTGGFGGTGNINVNPMFVDPFNSDYHLLSGSACIDSGDPSSDYSNEPEPNGGRINMGAYGNTEEATTSG